MRITSGCWRGTTINPPNIDSLQPSKGFVREVLFNWLRQDIDSSAVLDCFAGSGILAFESVSRGARTAELWETHPKLLKWLRRTCKELAPEKFSVTSHNAYAHPAPIGEVVDIVFLDPPFDHEIERVQTLIDSLHRNQRLRVGARIYLEQRQLPQSLGNHLKLLRERRCAGVSISLWLYQPNSSQS